MSNQEKRKHSTMLGLAVGTMMTLMPACKRIEIAGSIRRRELMVGDIELVAIPKLIPNLFGETDPGRRSEVDVVLLTETDWEITKDGLKYKQFYIRDGVKVDLFLQPDPATWGMNFLIRTGPASFSKWIVSNKRLYGGAMPHLMYVRNGRIWNEVTSEPYDTPEERDVFKLLGMDYIEPWDRNGLS